MVGCVRKKLRQQQLRQKQCAIPTHVLMAAFVKKQESIRILTAFVQILGLKGDSVMWTCVQNAILTLDA